MESTEKTLAAVLALKSAVDKLREAGYDDVNVEVICDAARSRHASPEKMVLLVNPKLDWMQKRQVGAGIEQKLSVEQIEAFAKPEFDWRQMLEIRLGYVYGLTQEQIAIYTKPNIDAETMRQIREREHSKARPAKQNAERGR